MKKSGEVSKTNPHEKELKQDFFKQPTLEVAKNLLGKFLVRERNGLQEADMITEVEAYDGPNDLACHAARGRTPRTEVMFGPGGVWYIHFVYGMHWMANIITGPESYPAGVLLRGTLCVTGPARLTTRFGIDKALNGKRATKKNGLWIEERGIVVREADMERTPRIGIAYAKEWAEVPYRFLLTKAFCAEKSVVEEKGKKRYTSSSEPCIFS